MTTGGGVPFGPFVLEGRLASGGSAEVWTARFANGEASRFVVKRLLPSLLRDAEARGAFAKEAALYARCAHPNIVSCFGAGIAGDEPWLAMELVLGADLDTVLRHGRHRGEKLETPIAVFVARAFLAALTALHEARAEDGTPLEIIHRDVTPSNIYLSTSGDVKLGDLGIARYITSVRTPKGLGVRGKFAYLAPEQVAAEKTDQRTDLFAAMNVLCEALLGRRLFDGSGQLAVLLAVRDARIDALQTHGGHLPPDLVRVLTRALARDPNERYPDARALSSALAPFAADEAIAHSAIGGLVERVRSEGAEREESAPPMVVSQPSMFPGAMLSMPPATPRATGVRLGAKSQYRQVPSHVRTTDGRTIGPVLYAQLVEMVASGALAPDDEIDFLGTGFVPLRNIDDLAGHLAPRRTAATTQIAGPGTPDWCGPANEPSDTYDGGDPGIAGLLAWIAGRRASGGLFATRSDERTEIYFDEGHAVHVALSDEQLAEALIARELLSPVDVARARAFAERFGDSFGHALIGLGMVDAASWSTHHNAVAHRAILELFSWRSGELSFYTAAQAKAADDKLALTVGPIIEEGVATFLSDERALMRRRGWKQEVVALDAPASLRAAGWSPVVNAIVERARTPIRPSALVEQLNAPECVVVRAIVSARLSRMIGFT